MGKVKNAPVDGLAAKTARLKEIEEIPLGALSDVEVQGLIAERSALREALAEAEKEKNAHRERALRRSVLQKEIADLSKMIEGGKSDEEIIDIVNHRKTLEAELEGLEKGAAQPESPAQEPALPTPTPPPLVEPVKEVSMPSPPPDPVVRPEPEPVVAEAPPANVPAQAPLAADPRAGSGGIVRESALEKDFGKYLDQVKGNPDALGSVLQSLPAAILKHKHFMLEVAALDPAYAMHYADSSLKQDEDFNLKVAKIPNQRHTGNPLAEMLPEARTEKVVLAGVKNDYRNVRFAKPEMASYREILESAKKGALSKVKEMKNGVDVTLLIPKPLQSDAAFMEEVKRLAPPSTP